MNGFFEVKPGQIAAITDGARFTDVCNRLIEAEASATGIAPSDVYTTHKTWDPDGGLDAVVNASVEHGSKWIPRGESGWQFKVRKPSNRELEEEFNKPNVQALFRRRGTYVLLVGAGRAAKFQAQAQDRLNALATAAGLPGTCQVLFAQQIARWACNHLSMISHQEFKTPIGNLQRYEDWIHSRRLQNQYEWDPARDGIRDQLQRDLSGDHHGVHLSRIEGGGGIGKTRLVLECLRDERFMPIVVYAARPDHIPPNLIGYFRSNNDRRAILVIDECDATTSEHWEHDTDDLGEQLRIITIGPLRRVRFGFTTAGYYQVGRLEPEALEKVIKKEARERLEHETLLYIQKLSSGNVRAALLLVENYREGRTHPPADLARADRNLENMLNSMVGPNPEVRRALTGLSLLSSLGVEDELGDETNVVAKLLGLDPGYFRELMVRGQDAGVVEVRGRQRYVSPEILAISLAGDFWKARSGEIIELYRLLPSGAARERFMERLVSLGDDPSTLPTIKALLEPGRLFRTFDDLNNRELGSLLQNLAMADPEGAVRLIENLLQDKGVDDLKQLNGGRRALVWTLEKLAWLEGTFPRAAESLLALAEAENERYSNNATGVWKQLFHLQLSGTETPISTRLDLLERLLSSPELTLGKRMLVYDALAEVFSRHLTRSISVVSLRGQPLPAEYSPRTVGEVREAVRRALFILWSETSRADAEGGNHARTVLLGKLAEVAIFGLGPDLLPILHSPRWGEWHMEAELVRGIDDALSIEDERWTEVVRQELKEIRDGVLELSFGAKLRRWLGKPGPADWRERNDPERAAEANAKQLAGEVFRDPSLIDPHWAWVVSSEAQRVWPFGFHLGELDRERSWEPRILQEVRDGRGSFLWSGYLAGRGAAGDGAWVDARLETLTETESIGSAIVRSLLAQGATVHAGHLILRLLTTGKVNSWDLSVLQSGGWIGQLPEDVAYDILEAALDRASSDDVSNVLELYGMRLYRNTGESERHEPFVWRLLETGVDAAGMAHDDWLWQHIAQTVVDKDPLRAAKIILRLFEGIERGPVILDSDHRIEVLRELLKQTPEDIWREIGSMLLRPGFQSYRMSTALGHETVKSIPLSVLEQWLDEHGDSGAEALAKLVKPSDVPMNPYSRMLLRRYGGNKRVTGALSGNLIEGVYSGPTSHMLRGHIDNLRQWEKDEDYGVQEWARNIRVGFEEQVTLLQRREQEDEF